MTGRDLLSDPWRERMEGARRTKRKKDEASTGGSKREGGGGRKRRGRGSNRELTSLIHLLVAFPVYILLPAVEYVGL